MDEINFETDKLLMAYYPRYAGGNFVLYCLMLSKHTLPQNITFATKLLTGEHYDYRIKMIKNAFAPKDDMFNWLDYENTMNEEKFFGFWKRNYHHDFTFNSEVVEGRAQPLHIYADRRGDFGTSA